MLPWIEEAAKEATDKVTFPRADGETDVENIHLTLISGAAHTSVRDLKSEQVSKLVKIPDIVVAASDIKAKATRMEGFDDPGVFFSDNLSES